MPTLRRTLPLAVAISVAAGLSLGAQSNTIGRTTLQKMHDAYAGKWYRSLTFVQKTTTFDSARTPKYETWYETVAEHGGRVVLRIDRGSPSEGNGVLYTADSLWSLRAGKVAATRATGNPFLPLIQGVYVQPVDKTIRELQQTGVDLAKGYKTKYEGANVTVIGAASAADSLSPQIWIDDTRNVLLRMLISFSPNRPPTDVHLGGYVRVADGWLATKISMYSNGVANQVEEYSDWKVNRPIPAQLFDVAAWTTAPHWAKP